MARLRSHNRRGRAKARNLGAIVAEMRPQLTSTFQYVSTRAIVPPGGRELSYSIRRAGSPKAPKLMVVMREVPHG